VEVEWKLVSAWALATSVALLTRNTPRENTGAGASGTQSLQRRVWSDPERRARGKASRLDAALRGTHSSAL